MQHIINFLYSLGFSKGMIVAIVSMLPIFELRGAIPLGYYAFKMGIIPTTLYALLGNIFIIPLILWILDPLNKWLEKIKGGNNIIEKLRKRAIGKSKLVQKLEYVGLMLFVAIPLPGSGAWTGALIAFFLKMKLKKAFIFIVFGVIIAGIVIATLTYLVDIGIIKNSGIFLKKINGV